jgi:opacity protein-like surface antigen
MTILKSLFIAACLAVSLVSISQAADTATTKTIQNAGGTFGGNYSFIFSNASDLTGESAVVKVSTASLSGTPTEMKITKIKWAVRGMNVHVLFDANTDDRVLTLTGNGEFDADKDGGPIKDPRSTGATGNVLFTTVVSTDTARPGYTIYMRLEKVR